MHHRVHYQRVLRTNKVPWLFAMLVECVWPAAVSDALHEKVSLQSMLLDWAYSDIV